MSWKSKGKAVIIVRHREALVRNYLYLICLVTSFSLWAQQDERPESNLDLRGGKSVFQVAEPDAKTVVELHRSSGGDYFLQAQGKDGLHKSKTSRPLAEDLDQRFGALYLRVQYELPADPVACKNNWRLTLHGEEILVCAKSEQKNQEIRRFFDELTKALHP